MTPGTVFQDCDDCLEMVRVPAGSFNRGSPPGEEGRVDDEGPVQPVTISYPLAVSRAPVTVSQWGQYLNDTGKNGYVRHSQRLTQRNDLVLLEERMRL